MAFNARLKQQNYNEGRGTGSGWWWGRRADGL
jgi:hypothetical protein